jgi:hypothetical protein
VQLHFQIIPVVVFRIEAEFWLNRRGVDAILVQTLPNRLRQLHVPRRTLTFELEIHLHV